MRDLHVKPVNAHVFWRPHLGLYTIKGVFRYLINLYSLFGCIYTIPPLTLGFNIDRLPLYFFLSNKFIHRFIASNHLYDCSLMDDDWYGIHSTLMQQDIFPYFCYPVAFRYSCVLKTRLLSGRDAQNLKYKNLNLFFFKHGKIWIFYI